MTRDRTPNLADLAHALEMRWRVLILADALMSALAISLTVSVAALPARAILDLSFPIIRLLLLTNGAALVVSIVIVAVRTREPWRFLVDADRTYGLKSLLVSGFEFGSRNEAPGDRRQAAFEQLVVERAENSCEEIDPRAVYPGRTPRRSGIVAGLVVALGILLVLEASGWFEQPVPPYAQEAVRLEDAGRRLAERAGQDEELQQLADEIRRFGEQARRDNFTPDDARRRIENLSKRVEEQIKNLERTAPFEQNEDAEIPPETEDTIRRALQSGMSEGEVVELFTRMRSEGNTVPEIVDSLEEATPGSAPNANLEIDPERMQELLDQINQKPPAEDAESDILNDLQESQRVMQEMGSGLAEITEGEEREAGTAEESGVGAGEDKTEGESAEGDGGEQSEGEESGGQQGGTMAVEDRMDDDFRRAEETSPILREIQGTVTENTIMEIIIRGLPAEATSELTEQERDVLFERVVEEAVNREETPPELRQLVRNYFLRLTMAHREGADDEQ